MIQSNNKFSKDNVEQIKEGLKPVFRKDIILASAVINIMSLALPMVLLQVYDRLIPNKALNTLSMLIIGLVVILILDVLLRSARSYLVGWIGAQYEHETGLGAMKSILRGNLVELESVPSGEQLDRLSAIDSIRDFYGTQASLAIMDLPFVVLFLAILGYIGGWLLVVPVLLLAILGSVAFKLGVELREAIEEDALWEDRKYSFIIEVLRGVHSVKSMAMENLMGRRYEKLMENCSKSSYNVIYLNSLAQGIGTIFSQITMVAVAAIGSLLVIDNQITLGILAASILLSGRTVQPLLRALGIWTRYQHIQIAHEKLTLVNNIGQERTKETKELGAVRTVELKNFCFKYNNNNEFALKNINLKLDHGDIIGIRGGNSSGKSTLLWSLMGGLEPTSGELLINGENPEKYSTNSLRKRMAYLPSQPVLFQGTILDNLTMFQGDDKIDAVMKAAEQMDLGQILVRMPEGFETMVGDASQNELPAGIVQRIAIVRALASNPDVILFDEANSGLDSSSDEDLKELLEKLKGKCTIVLVSFRPSLLKLADRHYDLKNGELTEIKSPKSVGELTNG
ncbi:MAG: ATP-binding cassette domain-containing protein [Alphaproteobacteria bacterium]|nr:ATP-binding cassette domain-containing protein [Alphaproteobacteria bacterium]HPF45394.1 ABC transporter transmembrane domain-containing protein [Emcibacteraceae bacterium]